MCYGLDYHGAWRWHITVSLAADRLWWGRLGVKRLWVRSHVKMSLGQAFEWKESMEGGRELRLRESEGEWQSTEHSHGRTRFIDVGKYKKLVQALDGRSLLREELESFVSYYELEMEEEEWLFYIQLGALKGDLRIRHGVQREARSVLRGMFKRENYYRCVRCGSGEERLHRTDCPHCGKECPYCEACLTMGRARFCGLLVQGVSSNGKSVIAGSSSGGGKSGIAKNSNDDGRRSDIVRSSIGGEKSGIARSGSGSGKNGIAKCSGIGNRKSGIAGYGNRGNGMNCIAERGSGRDGSGFSSGLLEVSSNQGQQDSHNGLDAGKWRLSPAQADAARTALAFLSGETESSGSSFLRMKSASAGNSFLLWAVTGAGKTEMTFPLIEHALARGGRVLLATPRKDVVLELEPRMKAAFPSERIVTLYGGSRERWERGSITLATTHQLFRYREAFDLVIVDEIDAFPFHGDEQLLHAAKAVCRPSGKYVLLSATPPKSLRDLARRGRLPHAKVCVRFHRHPLPVPQRLRVPPLRRIAGGGGLPESLLAALRKSLQRGAQVFVFVPHIHAIPGMVDGIRAAFPDTAVEGTYSRDEGRTEKVERFRGKELRVIVTTTILERGVTVAKTDVFIMDADSALFDDASLIQMAGRAGRKLEDPCGNVVFCAPEWTRSQRDAVRQIRQMNRLARKRGYLVS